VVAEEPCLVALPLTHRLASREVIDFTELLDEPFLALPAGAGPLRDYWLALEARDGRPPRIGAEIASTDETYEAIVGGQGICLLAAGNAPLIAREGVITRPVRGLSPTQLALAWRTGDHRPLVVDYARACQQATQRTG
jgi:DNA-binding transcriptional LysR family regulator